MYLKHVITAGILSAVLALGPGAAFAQTSGSSSGTSSPSSGSQSSGSQGSSTQGSTSSSTTSSSSSSQQSGSGGSDQEAVRQHLTGAREALAELTKLPAATQLQGESRQRIAQFISDFNSFATATTDWRGKYETVDKELDQLIGADSGTAPSASASAAPSAGATGSTPASPSTPADPNAPAGSSASGAVGTGGSGEAGSLDPTIVAKLREVRTHLDQFEVASGDPTFVVEKIEKILDQAEGGSASGAVGTSGSSAGGSITLSAEQVQELRRHLDSIKAAAKR